jgi:hypothetical protein
LFLNQYQRNLPHVALTEPAPTELALKIAAVNQLSLNLKMGMKKKTTVKSDTDVSGGVLQAKPKRGRPRKQLNTT